MAEIVMGRIRKILRARRWRPADDLRRTTTGKV